ncbi:Amino acid transporter [Rhodospirillaceae bacterium LM-1]|nr:Amino acid transporter [Rhodospirillaceae bacterium LM-1]
MQTNELIAQLSADLRPVQRIAPPERRLMLWLLLAAPYLAVIIAIDGLAPELGQRIKEPGFLLEQAAALATALLAGYAALSLSVPGRPSWTSWLPLIPLSLWLGSLGQGCWQSWLALGAGGLDPGNDITCIPSIALGSLVPAVAMVFMLKRGLIFAPKSALLLAALASAGLAELALRLHHPVDASPVVLVWHGGIVFAIALLGRFLGPRLLPSET